MKISSRLIILLTLSVNAVLLVATFFILQQLEKNLKKAALDEIRVHAITLQLALEEDYLTGRTLDAQRLINRLSENPNIYGAILFDQNGQIEVASRSFITKDIANLSEVRTVLTTARVQEVNRQINGEDVYSIISPIRKESSVVGAIEIAQSISFIRAELIRERRNIAWTALSICAAILIVVSIVLHFSLSRPIQSLLKGAVAIGEGNLSHRVHLPSSSGEFLQLADEFNQMADRLGRQRTALAREAESKILLERKLRHTERLAALGRLAAGVAHEMGAPLQVIDGRAKQLLERSGNDPDSRQRNLLIIRTQADRIARIVRQMLNFARPYNLRLRCVVLPRLVQDVTESLEVAAQKNHVSIQVTGDPETSIWADQDLLRQVLLNIGQNAIQAMPSGGTLWIEWALQQQDEGAFHLIKLSDSGTGISAEHLEHIFDPFYTTKEVGSGTGLGLAISYRIIEEHGGWLTAANRPEGGAVFTIGLPQKDENSL